MARSGSLFPFILSGVAFLFGGSIAEARCADPSGTGISAAALAQFHCSSSRPLTDATGEREFRIKLDFPAQLPSAENLPWKSIDFQREPEAYLRALLAYGIRDNSDPAIDWRIEDNRRSHWCHAPWFHNARERLHGMTLERGSRSKELHELQTTRTLNWAVGFYNDIGCFALGEVWRDKSFPKTKGFTFPEGTYSIKLLFTSASTREVPYLTGSKEWNAAINSNGSIVRMRLLQIDVAVRDTRADRFTGWLFGTFIYDAYAPGESVWERLVPIGLMWGNDPGLTSATYEERGFVPREGWFNPAVAQKFFHLPRHNLGLHGRVNGPVDNPKAACLACHGRALDWGRAVLRGTPAGAEAALLLPIAPSPYVEESVRAYFRNLKPTEPFVAGTQSLDYSLQLAGGIANFRAWVAQSFPDEAANTTDVPSYKFKSEESAPAASLQEHMRMLRVNAGDTPRSDAGSVFVRGED